MTEFNKIAILSHILPPASSGQAIVLYRLLKDLSVESYCLITSGTIDGNATQTLPGSLNQLREPVKWWERLARLLGPLSVQLAVCQVEQRAKQIEKILRNEGCRVLIACSGDLLDIPAGAIAAKRAGLLFIPYFFDDYLYQWTGWRRIVAQTFERVALTVASGAIVPNGFLQKEYKLRYGITSAIIHNPIYLPKKCTLIDKSACYRNETAIVYTGAIYHAHYDAFRNLISAIKIICRPGLKLHLYTAQPLEELETNGICGEHVELHPHVPPNDVISIQMNADILFLPLAFDSPIPEVIRTSAPGKMGEYLAAGRPIIAHVPQGTFVAWYFRKYQCGIVVEKKDPNLLAETIMYIISDKKLRQDLAVKARKRAETDFDLTVVNNKFYNYINMLSANKS